MVLWYEIYSKELKSNGLKTIPLILNRLSTRICLTIKAKRISKIPERIVYET